MKKIFFIGIILSFSILSIGQPTYTFTGSGSWKIVSNWSNNTIPPSVLPGGSIINVNCAPDSCILDTVQRISVGAYLNVLTGSHFKVVGNLTIDYPSVNNTFTDPRDGQVYPFKLIGTQVWMTKNLNYAASGSWCYDDNSSNCNIYGRLYNWNAALTAAPPGWHLPSDAEWATLINFLGTDSAAGAAMKSITGWLPPNAGASNTSGFTALPGGIREEDPVNYSSIGLAGGWWTSTENITPIYAWGILLSSYIADVSSYFDYKTQGLSVRCIKD
jgi:uncharacterized protein (TIGR02145 family)